MEPENTNLEAKEVVENATVANEIENETAEPSDTELAEVEAEESEETDLDVE